MTYIRTTIKMGYDLSNYSKMVARRKNLTYSAYVEDLLLKDLEDNHTDFFLDFMKCLEIDKIPDEVRYSKSIRCAIEEGREVKDSSGRVIIAAKTEEELLAYKRKYKI